MRAGGSADPGRNDRIPGAGCRTVTAPYPVTDPGGAGPRS
ncbi:hypothetical protein SGL43_01012 [Streptomyces globisporus]|uniref:Uncharacterized protein n=1 Tax=Streptomyces globisporus TaxID=1908 RepID=A0ABN8UUS0_STRGL|nr:hypothetical protein SGL43_01012 [Streptomyces globisporus]